MSECTLSLREVTICYGRTVAVDALCLDVHAGEIFGLLGPNGCGKSTTLAAIAGNLTPSSGAIVVKGITRAARPMHYRRLLGVVPQQLAFYDDLTGADNLRFFGRLYGLTGVLLRQRVDEVLAQVALTEQAGRLARTYSGGMQRRLNLACGLLHRPALLLLDEPTVGLDPEARAACFATLRRLRDQGSALVFTTHHLEEAELLCDRVAIMDQGRAMAVGTMTELLEPPGTRTLEAAFLQLTGRSQLAPCRPWA